MGCLLACLSPMQRDAGANRRIATDDNSCRVLQNMRPEEDIQNNSVGWQDGEHPIMGLGTMSEQKQRGDNNKHNDMYVQGWLSEQNQHVDNNNHNDMYGQGGVPEENQQVDYNNHNNMLVQGTVSFAEVWENMCSSIPNQKLIPTKKLTSYNENKETGEI